MDAFFYETFEEEEFIIKDLLGEKLTYGITRKTIQESGHSEPPAKLISIRTQSIIPIEWQYKLEGIFSRTTGYDHLKQYLENVHENVVCGYLEEYATRAVAEHAILVMLALMRFLPKQLMQFKNFDRDGLTGLECYEKNLLVVGVGRIGSEIVRIGSGLGMNVRGVDIVQRHKNIQYTNKDEGIKWADVIICAMNLTDENRNYFNYKLLKNAKRGVIFINVARGEHAPLQDLLKLIQEGHLGGIGLDVFEDEPTIAVALRKGDMESVENARIISLMLKHPNVIFTPHNAFNTIEAVRRKVEFSVREILYFLQNKTFNNTILPLRTNRNHF